MDQPGSWGWGRDEPGLISRRGGRQVVDKGTATILGNVGIVTLGLA